MKDNANVMAKKAAAAIKSGMTLRTENQVMSAPARLTMENARARLLIQYEHPQEKRRPNTYKKFARTINALLESRKKI